MGCRFLVRDHSDAADPACQEESPGGFDAYFMPQNRNILLPARSHGWRGGTRHRVNMTYLVPFFMMPYGVSASGGGLLLTVMQGAGLSARWPSPGFRSQRQAARDYALTLLFPRS